MRAIDRDGLLLCDMQARAFELSVDQAGVSSAVFVRRYMNSRAAKWMDSGDILWSNTQPEDLLELVEEQYGVSEYGTVVYTHNEMFWIGYLYRFYSYTYERSSAGIYRELKPGELRSLFLPYHTLDPSQAIERILEAKGLQNTPEEEVMRQYRIYKKIRETRSSKN